MHNARSISMPLQRRVKPAGEYAGLFPKSTCEKTKMGNGHNDTIEGVEMMAEMVEKYHDQCEKIAPNLKGKNIAETAENIHYFLYNYFQYWADSALQKLRSPACSWHERHKGIDCKSYSILASCILTEMGIDHAIRQIKQPGGYSNMWTHVYVAVPKEQNKALSNQLNNKVKYVVIDGTIEKNEEVDFTAKNDKIMQAHQYVGMNAASCGCTKKNAKELKLNENGENRLMEFKKKLQKLGFGFDLIENILNNIRNILESGYPANELFIYFFEGELNIEWGSQHKKFISKYKNSEKRGMNIAAAAAAAASSPQVQNSIKKALKKIDWDKYIGGIKGFFQKHFYGGHICFGNTYDPKKVENFTKNDLPGILEKSGISGHEANLDNINYFNWLMSGYLFRLRVETLYMRSCSTDSLVKGIEIAQEYLDVVMKEVVEKLQEEGVELKTDGFNGITSYESVRICDLAKNGNGWNKGCDETGEMANFIGKINPNTGTSTPGGVGGKLDGHFLETGRGIDENGHFGATKFTANKDFTFDGGFLKNIKVGDIIKDLNGEKIEDSKEEGSGASKNSDSWLPKIYDKISGSDLSDSISGSSKNKQAGGWPLIVFGLAGLGLYMGTKKSKKKQSKK